MTDQAGGSLFCNSCVKVPVDPYSRQPTPSYERPELRQVEKSRKIGFVGRKEASESTSSRETLDSVLHFLESIPDYGQVHHLSNEQFRQKLEHLKRKQKLFLKELGNVVDNVDTDASPKGTGGSARADSPVDLSGLQLSGKRCYLEESRLDSPALFAAGSFGSLADDQDLLSYRRRDEEGRLLRDREEMLSANERWCRPQEAESDVDGDTDTDTDDSLETRSLPADSWTEWHPTVPKPFSFTLREGAEKSTRRPEVQAATRNGRPLKEGERGASGHRRVRPIPLASRIPLYEKLLAEKEERSRIVREESALHLMSQVRPFRLECDRRAWKSLTRSSPAISSQASTSNYRFRARPVPRNLFATDVYDRMLEDDYFRQVRKRVRAAELMKSSSLPPSMAIRERVKSAGAKRRPAGEILADGADSANPSQAERARSAATLVPSGGDNLAAILRCQASRRKLEREMRERTEEKRWEQETRLRESAIGRKPAWRALRSAARHEHERDLDVRASLRRHEAREQAERHRLQMAMMLERVTRMPALFERHSQSAPEGRTASTSVLAQRKSRKKKTRRRRNGSSVGSCASYGGDSRRNSRSSTSSSGNSALGSVEKSSSSKRRLERGPLKVSINDAAELIDDRKGNAPGLRGAAE